MKGCFKNGSYYGYIPSVRKYWQFATEQEYIIFLKERGEI